MKLSDYEKVKELVDERDRLHEIAQCLADGEDVELSTATIYEAVTLTPGDALREGLSASCIARLAAIEAELVALGVEPDVEPGLADEDADGTEEAA